MDVKGISVQSSSLVTTPSAQPEGASRETSATMLSHERTQPCKDRHSLPPAAKGTDWLHEAAPENRGDLRLTYDSVPDHLKHEGIEERGDGD